MRGLLSAVTFLPAAEDCGAATIMAPARRLP